MTPKAALRVVVVPVGLAFALAGASCDSKAPDKAAEAVPAPAAEAEPEAKPVTAAEKAPTKPAETEASDGEADAKPPGGVAALVDEVRGEGEATGGSAEPIEQPAVAMGPLGPLPPEPLAKVGTVEIPLVAFTSIYGLKVAKYADRGRDIPPTADRRYRKSITERLIYHELLAQEAKRLGVDFDPAELKEREAQQRLGIRDWAKHLARRGETEASLRALYIAELREKVILKSKGVLEIAPSEIVADYEKIKGNWTSEKPRVRASHILVPLAPSTKAGDPEPSAADKAKWEAEAEKTALEIHAEVTRPGVDFAAVAKVRSTGPSASKGGDIGIFTADRMAQEFSDAAFAMSAGEISKPVRTKFGLHIIKVTGKWPAGELPMSALEDQIRERLQERALHRGRRELKERLHAETAVVNNMEPLLGPEPRRRKRKSGQH